MSTNNPIDFERVKREELRWLVLLTLDSARPIGAAEGLILSAIQGVPVQVTALELRREIGYLEERGLLKVDEASRERPQWHAELTRAGVDVVEYTVACEPGIARPKKYW